MNRKMKGNLMLLLTALIWGTAFVAQSTGMDHVGPFTYNGIRNLIAAIVLIPVIMFFDRMKSEGVLTSPEDPVSPSGSDDANAGRRISSPTGQASGKGASASAAPRSDAAAINRRSYRDGIICGIFLFIASSFQQYGISMTTAGKAGFVTALYIVIVPVLGIFLHKMVSPVIWISVAIAVTGFYLLCIKEGFTIGTGDLLVLCCAFFFSFHILVIDHFNEGNVDGVRMSQAQFLTVAVLSILPMLLTEMPNASWRAFIAAIWSARWSILYTAVMSSGVAYTLQILAQRYTEPTTATLLMSLESVFAALSGWLILHERLSLKEFIGCALVFAAVILAQLPESLFHKGSPITKAGI
ncbi:MAG: DMT family transporter [Lachnospiraceae bacterium]|nr:DMT family transporter [Lachnospiraceae bacterium]